MKVNFSSLFHQSSKDLRKGHPVISDDTRQWPDEWTTTYYKTYPRFPRLALPRQALKANFFDLIQKRESRRDFQAKGITLKELAAVLEYSCGITGKMVGSGLRRAQPSGGARFPVEVYILVFRGQDELAAKPYHYNVQAHAIEALSDKKFDEPLIGTLFSYPFVRKAACAIILTSVFWRNQHKYGERGYRYILLEAGHIGQNVYLVSQAMGLKCTAMGGSYDASIERELDIDGTTESVVYTLILGK